MTYQNANKSSHLRNVAAYKESTVFPQLPFSQKYIKYISEKMVLKIILVQGFCPLKIKIPSYYLAIFWYPIQFRVRRSWMSQNTTVTYIIAVVKLLFQVATWKYSRLPITWTLATSNLALTWTQIDFPWISVIHSL